MQNQAITPGARVIHGDEVGVVCRVMEPRGNIYTLGAGGLQRVANDYEVAFPSRLSVVCDSIIAPWVARASHLPPATPEEIEASRAAAERAQADRRDQAARQREAEEERRAAFMIDAAGKVPNWAKAVILAELIEDRSDLMTDYHGSTTVRTVILGFSSHTRDLFPELRKAALNLPETAPLHDAPASAEHREKYSMGAGYYLKQGGRDWNGWKVCKRTLYEGARSLPTAEWALSPPKAAKPQPVARAAAPIGNAPGVGIEAHTHSKKGFAMWIVTLSERVERAEYDRLLGEAKALGGWYSRAWNGTPAGFAFKVQASAERFAQGIGGGQAPAEGEEPSRPAPAAPRAAGGEATAAKLRALADGMQGEIDHKFGDRLTNTPKRQREAASARLDGLRLQRTQQALRALADHHEAGTVPDVLAGVVTKSKAFELMRSEIEHSGRYYDAGRDTGRPAVQSPAALALWAMVSGPSPAEKAAADLRNQIEQLQFANIPGYFPTPAPVVAQMIEAARIPAGGCSVMEPSAGSGAILDAMRAEEPGCSFVIYERHLSLRRILEAKGYTLTGDDFTDSHPGEKVARVLMNPPFESGQDMAHVRRAFNHLEPGGRLVAIMSPGPFFRQDSKAAAFRAWFDELGGEKIDLPAGAFKASGTGVSTVMVTLDA